MITQIAESRSSKVRNSHSVIPSQKTQKTEPLLEIRNVALKDSSESGNNQSSSLKPDESIADQAKYTTNNLSSQHLDLNRTAFDYMPKYVLRQINEKRLINTNGVSNGLVYMPSTATTVMTPYALYNTKTQYENIVDNAARDLNRKSNKSTKIQAQLYHNSQQKQQNSNQMQQGTFSANVQQQTPTIQGSNKNTKLFSAYATAVSSNGSIRDKTETTTYDIRGNLSKLNEEFLNTLATNINLANSNANANANNLFSSAFMQNLPLKAQYEKITARAASTSNPHSHHNSHANSNQAQTARPKITK